MSDEVKYQIDGLGDLREQATDCINWKGFLDKHGYGQRRWRGKVHRAHRVAYVESNDVDMDEIKGKVVRHRCDNPACVNPGHLQLGSQADNVRDAWSRGRGVNPSFKGESHWNAKLSKRDVLEIRRRHKRWCPVNGSTALGREFGVSVEAISNVVSRKTWPDLKDDGGER